MTFKKSFFTILLVLIFSIFSFADQNNSYLKQRKLTKFVQQKNDENSKMCKDNSKELLSPAKINNQSSIEPKAVSGQSIVSSPQQLDSEGAPLPEGVLIYPPGPHYNSEGPDRDASLEWDPSIPLNPKGNIILDEKIEESERILREIWRELLKEAPASDIEQDGLAPGTKPGEIMFDSTLRGAPNPGSYSFKSYPNVATTGGPPDVDLNVGDTYVVAAYNSYLHIYNKTGTSQGTLSLTSLFTGLTNCSNGSACDPQIIYDDENKRYVVTALAIVGTNDSRLCVAVSKAETPITAASNWWTYEIDPAGTGIADYPHSAVGQDAIFIGAVWFPSSGGNQAVGWVINKTKTYAGQSLGSGDVAQYTFPSSCIMPQPAERRGFNQGHYPPTNTPHFIICPNYTTTGAHDYWRWPVPSLTSTPSLWQASVTPNPGTFVRPNNTAYTAYPIDALDVRLTDVELRWPYIWTCRTGIDAANAFNTVQWNQVNVSGATPSVIQSSEYTLSNSHIWMADCTVDAKQNFIINFTRASATGPIYVGGYLAGRQAGDTLNTLSGPLTIKEGEKRYENGVLVGTAPNQYFRWGDYNGASIDPNGCDIWVNSEYVRNRTSSPPNTGVEDTSWIRNYRFADCSVEPSAHLNKLDFFCVDTVSAVIIDTTGTPTNAVYRTQHGSVAATISGTGPNYTVSSTTISALNGVHGDNVWLTFRGGNGNDYSSSYGTIDCQRQVCVYKIDDLTGGCDNDPFHDRGEVLNYNIAIANYEYVDLPGPFQATLTCSDPDVEIINPTVYYPALPARTYAYSEYPVAVRYNGAWPANCVKTLTFNITDIRAVDNAWTNTGGGCSSSQTFTRIANADLNLTTTVFSESFDGTTFPPTGWARLDVVGTALNWARATGTVHPSGYPTHSGAGLAYANSWTASPNTAERLYRSTASNLSSYSAAAFTYWMFHDNQYTNQDYIQIQVCEAGTTTCATNGTHWVNVGSPVYRYNGAANVWQEHTVDLSAYTGTGHTQVQVGILGYGMYGNDMHIDDVALRAGSHVCENTICTPAPNLVYGEYFELDDRNCNNNTYVEPGEVGPLYIYLDNQGNDWAYNTTATLSCPTCDSVFGINKIKICDNQANYGHIPYGTGYIYGSTTANPFVVAVDPTVPCPTTGSQIPFQVTVQATNPYGPITINTPVDIGYDDSINPDPDMGFSYYDLFVTAPGTSGAGGRWGFTNAWTTTGAWTVASEQDLCWEVPDTSYAQNSGKNTANSISHLFSTVGATTNIIIYWDWDIGRLSAGDTWYLDWTYDGGTTWCNVISEAGTGAGSADYSCWGGSLYYTVRNGSGAPANCWGPAAANSMLNNPNFGLRIRISHDNTNNTARMAGLFLAATGWQCTSAGSCTGQCPATNPPPTPSDNSISGQPFRVYKGTNAGTVRVTWDTSCGTPDNFNIYWGDLATLRSTGTLTVTRQHCGIGTSGNVDNLSLPDPTPGNGYWGVITAVKGSQFGRHGNNSAGVERTIVGDAAACGGTKNITQSSCSGLLMSESKEVDYQKIREKIKSLAKKPLSRCDSGICAPKYREYKKD